MSIPVFQPIIFSIKTRCWILGGLNHRWRRKKACNKRQRQRKDQERKGWQQRAAAVWPAENLSNEESCCLAIYNNRNWKTPLSRQVQFALLIGRQESLSCRPWLRHYSTWHQETHYLDCQERIEIQGIKPEKRKEEEVFEQGEKPITLRLVVDLTLIEDVQADFWWHGFFSQQNKPSDFGTSRKPGILWMVFFPTKNKVVGRSLRPDLVENKVVLLILLKYPAFTSW